MAKKNLNLTPRNKVSKHINLPPGIIIQPPLYKWTEGQARQELQEFRAKQLYRWLQNFLSFDGFINYIAEDNYIIIDLCNHRNIATCCTIKCIGEFDYKIEQEGEVDTFISGIKLTVDYVKLLVKQAKDKEEV